MTQGIDTEQSVAILTGASGLTAGCVAYAHDGGVLRGRAAMSVYHYSQGGVLHG
jgi:hypothetical protein